MDLEREDWLLVLIVAVFVVPFAASQFMDGGGEGFQEDDPEIVRMCEQEARAAETNSTLTRWDADCSCVPPSEVNPEQFPVADRVENATTIYLVKCELAEDAPVKSPFIIPVRRITDPAYANATGNTTFTNGTRVLR